LKADDTPAGGSGFLGSSLHQNPLFGFGSNLCYVSAMTGKIKKLEKLAADEVEAVLAALPAPLVGSMRQVPVLFERLPDQELQESGIEADTLGLFTGPELAHEGDEPMPPQIVLFLENLWDEAEENEAAFRNEVRITYLHELGHYLGLDEDDLFERGLE